MRKTLVFFLFALASLPLHAEEKSKTSEWAPAVHIQTSPIGDIFRRYNLQIGHFFTPNLSLAVKGTRMNNASQAIYGKDDGYEVGGRASGYIAPANDRGVLGFHVGLYYADFRRGNDLADAIDYIFRSSTVDRDDITSILVEAMIGPLVHWNENFTTEFLAGLQTYKVDYNTYNTKTGNSTVRKSSKWEVHPVLEANVGWAF